MAAQFRNRTLIASIGDEDTVTGLLLAGTGHLNPQKKKNFFVVTSHTPTSSVETAFKDFTQRQDIAILLITQPCADMIRALVEKYDAPFPSVLEIPSKDQPYDPSKDSVLKRVHKLFGE